MSYFKIGEKLYDDRIDKVPKIDFMTQHWVPHYNEFIKHHDAVDPQEEIAHYEVIEKCENGGETVKKIVDQEEVIAQEAYDEYATVYTLEEYSAEEQKEIREQLFVNDILQNLPFSLGPILSTIMSSLQNLSNSDAIKFKKYFLEFNSEESYKKGQIVIVDDKLYRCLAANSGSDISDKSKWELIEEGKVYSEWIAPTAFDNSYSKGSIVSKNGELYQSIIDDNSQDPESNVDKVFWQKVLMEDGNA